MEDTEDTDVDVEEAAEDVTEDEETSDEELFSAEVSEDEFADEAGDGQTEGEAYVLMNIPYDDFYKAELKNNDVKLIHSHLQQNRRQDPVLQKALIT